MSEKDKILFHSLNLSYCLLFMVPCLYAFKKVYFLSDLWIDFSGLCVGFLLIFFIFIF